MWSILACTFLACFGSTYLTVKALKRQQPQNIKALPDKLSNTLHILHLRLAKATPQLALTHPHPYKLSGIHHTPESFVAFSASPDPHHCGPINPESPFIYLHLGLKHTSAPGYALYAGAARSDSPSALNPTGDPTFEQHFTTEGPADVILARLDHAQRIALLAQLSNLHSLAITAEGALLTWRIYPHLDERQIIDIIERALTTYHALTAPIDTPKRLLDQLKAAEDDALAQRLLKSLLRYHEHSAAGQGAIKWTLRQPSQELHAVMALTCPHLLKQESRLAPLLIATLTEHSIDPNLRAQCLSLLAKHARHHLNTSEQLNDALTTLCISEPSVKLRATALERALRRAPNASTQTALSTAVIALSAQHTLRSRALDPIQAERLKRLLGGLIARPTLHDHLLIASKHADRGARYASLTALFDHHPSAQETLHAALDIALYEPDQLLSDLCTKALMRQGASTWQAPLAAIALKPTLPPATRALAHIAQGPHTLAHTLDLWQNHVIPLAARHKLIDLILAQEDLTQAQLAKLCLTPAQLSSPHAQLSIYKQLLSPKHLGRLPVGPALKTLDTHTQAALINYILSSQPTRYTPQQRQLAAQYAIELMELPSLRVWPCALELLKRFASNDAIAPLSALLSHTYANAPRTPAFTALLQQTETLLLELTARAKHTRGSLSLYQAPSQSGALSVSHAQGQLAIIQNAHNSAP